MDPDLWVHAATSLTRWYSEDNMTKTSLRLAWFANSRVRSQKHFGHWPTTVCNSY